MQVTLAMGLQYQSGKNILPSAAEGVSLGLQESNAASSSRLATEAIIDVQAITDSVAKNRSGIAEHFDYLAYNIHAAFVLLPRIGTQLDLSI